MIVLCHLTMCMKCQASTAAMNCCVKFGVYNSLLNATVVLGWNLFVVFACYHCYCLLLLTHSGMYVEHIVLDLLAIVVSAKTIGIPFVTRFIVN